MQAEQKWAARAFITCRTSTQLSHLNLPPAGAEPIGVAPAGLHRRPALTRRPTGLLLARLLRLRRADPGPSRRALCHAGYGTATSCGRPFHWVASAGPCAKSKTLAGGSRACFRPPRPPCFASSGALTVGRERTRSTRRVSGGRLSRPRPARRTRESKWARVPVPRPGRAHGRGWASGHVAPRTLPCRPVLLGMQVRVRGRGAIPQPAHRVVQ